jgi:hypothetical protein
MRVSKSICEQEAEQRTTLNVIFFTREWHHQWQIMCPCFCGGNESDAAVGLRSRENTRLLRDCRSWGRGKVILAQIDLIIDCQA